MAAHIIQGLFQSLCFSEWQLVMKLSAKHSLTKLFDKPWINYYKMYINKVRAASHLVFRVSTLHINLFRVTIKQKHMLLHNYDEVARWATKRWVPSFHCFLSTTHQWLSSIMNRLCTFMWVIMPLLCRHCEWLADMTQRYHNYRTS